MKINKYKIFNNKLRKQETRKGGTSSSDRRTRGAKIAARQVAIGMIKSQSKKRLIHRQRKQSTLANEIKKGAATYKTTLKKVDLKGSILDKVTLSNKPLVDLNLKNIKIINSKLSSTKFIGSNLTGSVFENNEMNKVNFQDANLTNAKFKNIKIINEPNFTNSIMQNIKFDNVEGTIFKWLESSAIPPVRTGRKELNNITIINSQATIHETGYTVSNKKLINPIFTNNTFTAPHFENIDFINGEFKNIQFINTSSISTTINYVEFEGTKITNCLFHSSDIKNTNFTNCHITNNKFYNSDIQHCKMTNLRGAQGSLRNNSFSKSQMISVNFTNSDLENSTFNGSNMKSVNFTNANLNGTQYIPLRLQFTGGQTQLLPAEFGNRMTFTGASFAGATFQETRGLEDRNFNNMNFVGASFHGCSLMNSTFRNADLRNAIFNMCVITECDFTGANIDGIDVSPDTLATGDANNGLNNRLQPVERTRIYPTDIHAAFALVDLNKLFNLLPLQPAYNYTNSQTLKTISDIIKDIINDIKPDIDDERGRAEADEKKRRITRFWTRCSTDRLETFNFQNDIRNTNPTIKWNSLLLTIIHFVDVQSIEFKESYVTEVIVESATTYGEGGLSCPAGIVERFVVKLKSAIQLIKPILENDKNYNKLIEYNKILNIVDTTQELPTTREEIERLLETPQEEEQTNFEVTQQMRDHWREFHKTGGPDQFQEDDEVNDKIEKYKHFLQYEFDYDNKSQNQKEILNEVIKNELEGMAAVLEYDDEFFDPGDGTQGGGQRKHLSIFSNKKLFQKLCKKYCTRGKRRKTRKRNRKTNKKTNRKTRRN